MIWPVIECITVTYRTGDVTQNRSDFKIKWTSVWTGDVWEKQLERVEMLKLYKLYYSYCCRMSYLSYKET